MALITCENLTLSYENNIVLTDLSFEVSKGDYLCIVGENGSGKSTLVKTLLSLKKPTAGKITFGDGLRPDEIGYLPQKSGIRRDFPASVGEVVLSGCLNRRGLRPFYNAKEKEAAKRNLARLGLENMEKKNFDELSGGQQQRVLLARALCAAKELLLLDEPATGLDPLVTAELYSIIRSLSDDGITILMVTHDLNAAVQYSSHILHLHNKPLFFGKTEDYVESEIGKKFFGMGEDHESCY